MTFDPLLTFKHHVSNTKAKVMSRTNVLKALAGSSWGKDKETLLSTYNAISKPILDYCTPIFTLTVSASNWNELQIAQNSGLRD